VGGTKRNFAELKPCTREPRKQQVPGARLPRGSLSVVGAVLALILLRQPGFCCFKTCVCRTAKNASQSDELRQSEQKLQEEMQAQRSAAPAKQKSHAQ
jgi:hypothetical protein